MVRVVVAALVLASLGSACRLFQPEKYRKRDECARYIRFYRQEPENPYRVIKVITSDNELDIAYHACAQGADAVLVVGYGTNTKTHGVGSVTQIGDTPVIIGGSTTSGEAVIHGAAIRFIQN